MKYANFRSQVFPLLKTTEKCPIKQEIGRQLSSLGRPKQQDGWDPLIRKACAIAGRTFKPKSGDQLVYNLTKGKGSRHIAVAIYYWLHITRDKQGYAREIDEVAFGDPERFDGAFDTDDIEHDILRVIEPDPTDPQARRFVDANTFKQFLDRYELDQQLYPSLLLLYNEIESILDAPTALKPDGDAPVSLRLVLDQSDWLDYVDVITTAQNANQWTVKGQPFMQHVYGANFVLIRDDGTRATSNCIHRLHSWLMKIDQLIEKGVVPEDEIDLLMRYILVLMGFRRASFLKFYFNDDVERLDRIFRIAARRAHAVQLDMRDYGPLDHPYDGVRKLGR